MTPATRLKADVGGGLLGFKPNKGMRFAGRKSKMGEREQAEEVHRWHFCGTL